MGKKFDLAVKIGEKSDGKAVWKTIGVVMEGDKGPYMLLDKTFNPAGIHGDNRSSILVSMFEPKPKNDQPGSDQIPF